MLTINLGRLDREGSVQVEAAVPPDDPLWEGTKLAFDGPVHVRATASLAGSGEVVVRGSVEATLLQACRRCLEPVRMAVDEELILVYSPRDELGTTENDPEMRVVEVGQSEVDLAAAVREELMLDLARYLVCREDCRGLCPRCGVNRNEEECDCTLEEPDPRWDALRALKND